MHRSIRLLTVRSAAGLAALSLAVLVMPAGASASSSAFSAPASPVVARVKVWGPYTSQSPLNNSKGKGKIWVERGKTKVTGTLTNSSNNNLCAWIRFTYGNPPAQSHWPVSPGTENALSNCESGTAKKFSFTIKKVVPVWVEICGGDSPSPGSASCTGEKKIR